MKGYREIITNITAADSNAAEKSRLYLDSLSKPPGSLGKLEDIVAKLCGIFGDRDVDISKRCVIVAAADNGVVEEGVSSAPQWVTISQTKAILDGTSGVGVLANCMNADLVVADIGINGDIDHPKLIDGKIRRSTGNIKKEPAMSLTEAEQAIDTGVELVYMAVKQGYTMLGVGEMGIGNTTTSSAVLASLLGLEGESVAEVVGRGAGLTDSDYQNKVDVVKTALELHSVNLTDVVGVLSHVGGLDLATMTGVYLGAAYHKIPVVVDGFISIVAALCAVKLSPSVKDYLFLSHHSFEKGYATAAKELALEAPLKLDMRLGEGSGCPIMFSVMDGAVSVLKNMATLSQANIGNEYTDSIKGISF